MLIACLILCQTVLPLMSAAAQDQEVTGAPRFKQEYELLNGQSNMDGSNTYQTLDIPEDSDIIYADMDSIRALFENGTGILFLGFPECPWCRTLIPTLISAVREAGYGDTLLYYNALYDRDKKHLDDDGNIVVDEPGNVSYQFLVEQLYDHLGPYAGLEDETIKRIYFPTTAFVKDGRVLSAHLVTVESQTNAYEPLDSEQRAELYERIAAQVTAIHAPDQDNSPADTTSEASAAPPETPIEINAFAYDQCVGCDGPGEECSACDDMLRLKYMLTIALEDHLNQGAIQLHFHNVIDHDASELYEQFYEASGLTDADYREFPAVFVGEAGKSGALAGAKVIRKTVAGVVGAAVAE